MELFFSMETLKEKFKYQGTSAHSNFQETVALLFSLSLQVQLQELSKDHRRRCPIIFPNDFTGPFFQNDA